MVLTSSTVLEVALGIQISHICVVLSLQGQVESPHVEYPMKERSVKVYLFARMQEWHVQLNLLFQVNKHDQTVMGDVTWHLPRSLFYLGGEQR